MKTGHTKSLNGINHILNYLYLQIFYNHMWEQQIQPTFESTFQNNRADI